MYNYLFEHAALNVWCGPDRDNQIVISGPMITKTVGALNKVCAYDREIALPTKGERYHVYQIGQLHPLLLGLKDRGLIGYSEAWTTFTETINKQKVWVDVCTENGVSQPRFRTYFMFTKENGLLLAIPLQIKLRETSDRIYLRVYSNTYFETLEADSYADCMFSAGRVIKNTQDILDFESQVNSYKAKTGAIFYYWNGLAVGKLNLANVAVGDIVEFIYDSSVRQILELKFKDIPSFTSTLDIKNKYLLHHPDIVKDTISYFDDVEYFVGSLNSKYGFKALYYLRTTQESVRMVTHRDYSLPVAYVDSVMQNYRTYTNTVSNDDDIIHYVIRKGCVDKPLVYENNRIFELYKLPDDKVLQAMVGIEAAMVEWQAASLEASAYCRLMSAKDTRFNNELVKDTYGYNGASKYLGDTPVKPISYSGVMKIQMPYNLMHNSTVYEYDSDGFLIGTNIHYSGSEYICTYPNTKLCEVIAGIGTDKPEVIFGTDNISIPSNCEYRVYMCYYVNGFPNNIWKDITGSQLYSVNNNVLIWNQLETDQFLMIRTDKTFLTYSLEITPVDGLTFFTLAEIENRGAGSQNYSLPVPLGDLDIWVNDKACIRGLGYFVDFPMVYIVDKELLKQPADSVQKITVRFTGFSDSNLTIDKVDDYGFIEHGYLSNNSRFDIRDDKVVRITVEGRTIHRSYVQFSEEHDGIQILDVQNGMPYQIKDILVPMRNVVNVDTYEYRKASEVIDKHVSDYLTIKKPQIDKGFCTIPKHYQLYSPFLTKIIVDMVEGEFNNIRLHKSWTINDMLTICKPYEYLLEVDPGNLEIDLDRRFIVVVPHSFDTMMDLDIFQYRFLVAVVKRYFNNRIDLTSFVRMVS